MATCPRGHDSQADDYCDVCGERLTPATSSPAPGAPPNGGGPGLSGTQVLPSRPGGVTACPDCSTPATDRFCEVCGYDFATGGGRPTPPPTRIPPPAPVPPESAPATPARAPAGPAGPAGPAPGPLPGGANAPGPGPAPAAAAWTAVVTVDREYYNAVMAEEGPDSASLTFPLYTPERRIPLDRGQILIGRRSSAQRAVPDIDLREPPEDPGVSHTHAVLLAKPDGTWTLVDPGSMNRTFVNGTTDPIPYNVEVPLSEGDRIHVGAWTTITLTRGEAT